MFIICIGILDYVTNLSTFCIITNTCRGRQRPGDVKFYSEIQRLNPFYFNNANSNFYFEIAMYNKSHRNMLMYFPVLAKVYKSFTLQI